MQAGLRYVALSPAIRAVLVHGFFFGLMGSAIWALMPLIARDLLGGGALIYGTLFGAFGVGAVIGALLAAVIRQRLSNHAIITLSSIAFGLMAVGVALSHQVALTMALLLVSGMAWVLALSTLNITVQISSPRWVVGSRTGYLPDDHIWRTCGRQLAVWRAGRSLWHRHESDGRRSRDGAGCRARYQAQIAAHRASQPRSVSHHASATQHDGGSGSAERSCGDHRGISDCGGGSRRLHAGNARDAPHPQARRRAPLDPAAGHRRTVTLDGALSNPRRGWNTCASDSASPWRTAKWP